LVTVQCLYANNIIASMTQKEPIGSRHSVNISYQIDE
jgi:hypothetical protein